MKAIIIAGGSCISKENFINIYRDDDYIICADGGLNYLDRMNMKPNLIVGDLDSVDNDVLIKYDDVEVIKYKPEKDFTDTELAIEQAIELGYKEIILVCATGSRFDHTLANVMLAYKYILNSINITIIDNNNYIKPIIGIEKVLKDKYKYVSIVPITETITVDELEGFKYPLVNKVVEKGSTLCISNEVVGKYGFIKLKEGIGLLIKSND